MSIIPSTNKITHALRLLKKSFWGYRLKLVFNAFWGLLAGLFGGIGIGAVIPLFSFIIGENQIKEADFVTNLIKKLFAFFNIDYSLLFILALVVVLFILKAAVTYYSYYLGEKIVTDYEKEARVSLFRKTLHADWPHLMEQKVGYLESVLMNDTNSASGILGNINSIIMIGTSLAMYALIALNISVYVTLITFGIGIALFFALKPLLYKIRTTSAKLAAIAKSVGHHVSQHTIGAKTIKSTATEEPIIEKSSRYLEDLRVKRLKLIIYNRIPGTFLEPIGFLFIAAIFLYNYHYNPGFNIASFAATIYLVQKMFSFMQSIQGRFNNINEALPHLKIIDDYASAADKHKEFDPGVEPFIFKNNLELKNITFAYNKKNIVINNVSFSIKRGEAVGLIGPSGVGKTTLVDIILRLLQPGAGEIMLDGKDALLIRIKDWRKKIGYVSQDIFLLNDTIENNIRFYDESISKEEIINAAKIANAYEFIKKAPNKFQSLVGERGLKLSVGQRQRIILARILAKKPEIIILDEATSALDNESELLIHEAIGKLKGKTTMFVIAHRLSTIMNSDKLFVLENGKIIEQGKPAELLKDKDSYFYKVYNIREK